MPTLPIAGRFGRPVTQQALGFTKPGGARPATGHDAWVSSVPPGYVRMRPEDSADLALRVELGDSFPIVDPASFGGWRVTDIPGRTGITDWTGHQPIRVDLPLFFDSLETNQSIEWALEVLEALAGRGKKRRGDEPPRLKVDTGGVMQYDLQAFPSVLWVIDSIDYDEDTSLRNDNGNRVRQNVTITLLQYNADVRLQTTSAAAKRRLDAQKKKSRVFTVKKGQDLIKIAAKELHNASRWKQITTLKGKPIRDPRSVKAGDRVRLPG